MTNAKMKIYSGLAKAKNFIDKSSIAVMSAASGLGLMGITASAAEGGTSPVVDLSSVDFGGLTSAITGMVPQVLPVAVTVLGIRKAISFMMSTIRGC